MGLRDDFVILNHLRWKRKGNVAKLFEQGLLPLPIKWHPSLTHQLAKFVHVVKGPSKEQVDTDVYWIPSWVVFLKAQIQPSERSRTAANKERHLQEFVSEVQRLAKDTREVDLLVLEALLSGGLESGLRLALSAWQQKQLQQQDTEAHGTRQ